VTADKPPRFSGWAVAGLATAVALLLFSMQVAFLSLTANSSPDQILVWQPEATVSEDELARARAAQAAGFDEMKRLGQLSLEAYGAGLIAFLFGVLALMIPRKWSAGWMAAVGVMTAALLLEIWWEAANRWPKLHHPVTRKVDPTHKADWNGDPPALDAVGLESVLNRGKRDAVGPTLDDPASEPRP
jgi:hypothetical protein